MRAIKKREQELRIHYSNPHYSKAMPEEEFLAKAVEAERNYEFNRYASTMRYHPRSEQHYRLIFSECPEVIKGTVLDMGSRTDTCERLLGRPVARFDKNNPELRPFDWEKEELPVADASYDTVVCLDTLEHIDTIHAAVDDLFRVARCSLAITLPNCWRRITGGVLRGHWKNAGYGIPLEKPFDRHKWFFNTEEAFAFLAYRAAKNGWKVSAVRFHAPKETWWQRFAYPWVFHILPDRYSKNLFTETLFMAFEPELNSER